ncbi:MAG: hypothetical protein BroJett029_15900 [Alphaproteobacteria bacterium]|nr:MAG: hypothetical protein BroJett029_15900 [Alphaproteobacteria bacterium]
MALAPGFAAGAAFPDDAAVWDFSMLKRLVLSFLFFGGTAVVLGGLLFSGALGTRPAGDDAASTGAASAPPLAGTVADFTRFDPPRPAPETPFADGDGNGVSLADFRGRVVLLNFWATWCVPCVKEMPALDRLQAQLGGEGLEVVALSQDRDGVPAVVRFYEKYDFGHLGIYVDPKGSLAGPFGVGVLPTTILIDRNGNAVGQLIGEAEWDAPEAQALIRHYLDAGVLPDTTTASGG